MPENEAKFLEQLNIINRDRHNLRQIILTLSLIVVLIVFWNLKLTGIGIAGEAFCGKEEHGHSEECVNCTIEEHIHTADCYSDVTADLETSDDWEMTLADMVRGPTTKENVVLVAKSQLGYTESTLNFQVDANGVRRGITRYGQWYGNPYGDWSAMFASFCLEYAGATDLPMNAGPEAMRLEWEAADLYWSEGEALPGIGDLVFLCKDSETAKANAVAIITQVSEQTVTVIQGDLNDTVAEATYALTDPALLGYGVIPDSGSYNLLADAPFGTVPLAQITNYSASLISGNNQFVFYTTSGGNTYAIDGNGNAVQVYIGNDGQIYTDLPDPNVLLWSISSYSSNAWAIQNVVHRPISASVL